LARRTTKRAATSGYTVMMAAPVQLFTAVVVRTN